jgi:hypothetical protein
MARKVKCCITGEYGTNETFFCVIKNGKKKYYKSEEVYYQHEAKLKLHKDLIAYILTEILGYAAGQVPSTILFLKLQELKFYEDEVILETFKAKKNDILYQINQPGKFRDDNSKIFYMFAIIKNNINDVYKKVKTRKPEILDNNSIIYDPSDLANDNTDNKQKDISRFLEDEDI